MTTSTTTGLLDNSAERKGKKVGNKRLTDEEKAEKKQFADMAKAEKKRLADIEKAEKKRLADIEKAEKKRLADIEKAEKKRLADEKKQRQAAEKKEVQERLVYKTLHSQSHGKSFSLKVLADEVSMSKADFVAVINQLFATGRLQVTAIDVKFNVVGVKLVSAAVQPVVSQPSASNDYEAFRKAVEKLGQGPRSFVWIHNMRCELGWTEERFNTLLRKLRADGTIQLHGGDGDLTAEEKRQCFEDEYGSLYATLTWKKR